MLSDVRTYMSNLPKQPFPDYYNQYIQQVQDKNIDAEIRYLLNHNSLDVKSMSALIQLTYERMRIIDNSQYLTETV